MNSRIVNHYWTRRLTLGGSLVLAVLYFAFEFLPWRAEMSARRSMLEQRQQLLRQAVSVPMKLTMAKQELAGAQSFSQQWRGELPTRQRLTEHQGQVLGAAERCEVRVARFDPGQLESLETLARMPLLVEVEGTFGNVASFLGEVESLPGVWVERAKIQAGRAASEDLSCELTLIWFARNSDHSDYAIHAPHPIPKEPEPLSGTGE